jgi:hypothetical protein
METNNALLLILVSQQLGNRSSTSMGINEPFIASQKDVQINVLYFLSLTLALSVSFVCILGKQWTREYQKDTPGSSSDAVRVRQARFDALQAWKLPEIMASLPVILQAALLLFFGGLLIQLWNVSNNMTAGFVSVIIGLTVLFVIVTTVVPAHWSRKKLHEKFTPFRSPQAWIYFVVYQGIHSILKYFTRRSHTIIQSWAALDTAFLSEENKRCKFIFSRLSEVTSVHRALRWVFELFRNSTEMEKSLLWCLQGQNHPQGWRLDDAWLSQYVLSGDTSVQEYLSDNLDHVRYNLSCAIAWSNIQHNRGRLQIELLIRFSNMTLDQMRQQNFQDKTTWDDFEESLSNLRVHMSGETQYMPTCK